jgi:hypothetical protein
VGDKLEHYTHHEQRQYIISRIGYDKWKAAGQEETFGDIAPPIYYSDLFSCFIDLYYLCPNGVTYQDIKAYCDSTQNQLSIHEISLIRKMCSWAASEVNKAWRESR